MPSEGKKSVAAELQQKFPGLLWLAGRHLREGLSTIKWRWLPTDTHSWKSTFQVGNADLGFWVLRIRFRSMQLSLLWMDFFGLAVGQ